MGIGDSAIGEGGSDTAELNIALSFFSGEAGLLLDGVAPSDCSLIGGCILLLGGLGSGARVGESILTGSSSMKCDIGGGPSSGEPASSASEHSASICSGLENS